MNPTTSAVRLGRKALALSALAGVFFAALLGLAAADAGAAYTARVDVRTIGQEEARAVGEEVR